MHYKNVAKQKSMFFRSHHYLVNTDGCAEQYICEPDIYLLSMLAHIYNIIIDCGVGVPVHRR